MTLRDRCLERGWVGAVLGAFGGSEGAQYESHRMSNWWMWLVWMGGFLVLVLVIYLVVYGLGGRGLPPGSTLETPLDILEKRYAKGEITREEYERMKRDLEA